MKKSNLILFFVVVMFIFSASINAKESLEYEWGTYFAISDEDIENESRETTVRDIALLDDGYVAVGSGEDENGEYRTLVIKYDKAGKEKDRVVLDAYCDSLDIFNENIYCLNIEYSDGSYQDNVFVYDYNGKVQETYSFKEDDWFYFEKLREDDEKIFLYNYRYVVVLNKNDSTVVKYYYDDLLENEIKEYLGEYYLFYQKINEVTDGYYYGYGIENDKKYLLYFDEIKEIDYVEIYDMEDKLILKKEITTQNGIEEVAISEDGFYVSIIKSVDGKTYCDYSEVCEFDLYIAKYDYEGTLIYEEQTHSIEVGYAAEGRDISKMLYNNELILVSNTSMNDVSIDDTISGYSGAILKFAINYEISTISDGNGSIEVIEKSNPDELVTFKIVPNDGYVLDAVKVTDTFGNTVTFNDYTFTMPTADVTIEATFVKKVLPINPETSDIMIIVVFSVFILGCLWFALSFNKMKRLG